MTASLLLEAQGEGHRVDQWQSKEQNRGIPTPGPSTLPTGPCCLQKLCCTLGDTNLLLIWATINLGMVHAWQLLQTMDFHRDSAHEQSPKQLHSRDTVVHWQGTRGG